MGTEASRVEKVQIRYMQGEDIDAIVKVEQQCFPAPWTKEAFESELYSNALAHYLVVALGDQLIGYAGMWIILDEAHVTNVAVVSEFRGNKYGKLLMKTLLTTAKVKGAQSMTLEVRRSNLIAQGLYKQLGFEEKGIRKNYYSETKEDALIMWCNI